MHFCDENPSSEGGWVSHKYMQGFMASVCKGKNRSCYSTIDSGTARCTGDWISLALFSIHHMYKFWELAPFSQCEDWTYSEECTAANLSPELRVHSCLITHTNGCSLSHLKDKPTELVKVIMDAAICKYLMSLSHSKHKYLTNLLKSLRLTDLVFKGLVASRYFCNKCPICGSRPDLQSNSSTRRIKKVSKRICRV